MFDSELQQYVAYSGFLYRAVSGDLENLITTIKECSAGYPTGHEGGTEIAGCDTCRGEGRFGDVVCDGCDGSGTVTITYDSRTQSAALHPDPARDARKELERNVKALRSALVNLDGLRQAWLFTTTDKPVSQGEPGCLSCARSGIWSPRHQQTELCQWCADWNRAESHYPPKSVLEAHHQGKRITNALLDKLGVKPKAASARDRRKAG